MIQKFRWKFIGTSVAALLLVLLITLGGLVGITRVQSKNEVDRELPWLKMRVTYHHVMHMRPLAIKMIPSTVIS